MTTTAATIRDLAYNLRYDLALYMTTATSNPNVPAIKSRITRNTNKARAAINATTDTTQIHALNEMIEAITEGMDKIRQADAAYGRDEIDLGWVLCKEADEFGTVLRGLQEFGM